MADLNSHSSSGEEISNSPSSSGEEINNSPRASTIIDESSNEIKDIMSTHPVICAALEFLREQEFVETSEMIDLKRKAKKEELNSSNYNLLIDNYTILAQNLANKDKSDLELQIYSLIMVACVHRCCGNDEKYGNCLEDIFTYADGSEDNELINRLEKIFC